MVPINYVLALLSRGLAHHEYITVPEPVGLPYGAIGIAVHYDYQTGSFALIVDHESFDEVPEGCVYPVIEVVWTTHKLRKQVTE